MLLPDETYEHHHHHQQQQPHHSHHQTTTCNTQHQQLLNTHKANILSIKTKTHSSNFDSSENRKSTSQPTATDSNIPADQRRQSNDSYSSGVSVSGGSNSTATVQLFTHITELLGDTFPPLLLDFKQRHASDQLPRNDSNNKSNNNNNYKKSTNHQQNDTATITSNADVLRVICENFLWRHRIRPDFFCQYEKTLSGAAFTAQSTKKAKRVVNEDKLSKELDNIQIPGPVKSDTNMRQKEEAYANATLALVKRQKAHNKTAAKSVEDASSSNEAVHLQQRLKSLSTELVTLRNRLHVGQGHGAVPSNGGGGGGGGAIPPSTPPHTGPTASGLNLNISSPNLHSGGAASHNNQCLVANNNSGGSSNFMGNGNNQSNHQQHPLQQQQPPHSAIIPTLTNGNNSNNNNSNNHNNCNISNMPLTACNTNKSSHAFSHTLPHNSSTGGGIVSTRNTSIPHPLPPSAQAAAAASAHNAHTLPLRSSVAHNAHSHQLGHNPPFMPLHQKHSTSTCHGNGFNGSSSTFGYLSTNNGPRLGGGAPPQLGQHSRSNSGHNSNSAASSCNGTATRCKQPYEIEDLIHLPGPLTEDAVMRTLQARFNDNGYFTNVGPILLSINPYLDVGNPLTLTSTRSLPLAPQLNKIVQEAVRQQAETGYPQAIILSGTSGAGKTHCSMLLLRQLFAVAGGGPETDAFKHLAAAFTVLRSLGSAKTTTNSESSRIGQFIEVQVTDGALYRTKIHCYFLDQTRVIRPLSKEKNYHIFYQMLAGLSREERIKLNLEGYSPANLRYLQSGDIGQNEQEDAQRFQAWKTCLGILGIPFLDVVRVLAAVLLLGNVQFIDGQGLEVDVKGESELNAVASLLGVPPAALFRGLTTRTHNARGQLVKSVCDANMSNMTRDCLAKALYCRTVATIVRRANSLKRLGSTLGTLSSDSNESVHNQADAASQHASTIGGNSGSKSMAALNNAVRHATDGFIGILDMFGFEEPPHAQLEHLCINLCAETMQHFYNTHIFKSSVESCRDEGIVCDTEVDYVDNVPCIDLISSLRTGLLSMLDAECSVRGTAESYVAKIKVQHRNSPRLETKHTTEPHDPRMFMIRHFAGRVEYDTTDFLDTNRDVVRDDLVAVFYKHTCNFGFATHLFGSELKALYALQNVPRGLSFRISPTSHTDLLNGDEPVSTLTQDFHTRLDNLLRTLVHARPHFVRCIRSNATETAGCFERKTVVRQIRSLQVLETVNLMASGFPHRMRFKQFNARYVAMLAPFHLHRRSEDKAMEDCNLILQYAMENPPVLDGSVTLTWAPGKRHVFLSEGMRQHLEHLRAEIRTKSATLIQATWRGWQLRKKMGNVKRVPRTGGMLVLPASKISKIMPNPVHNALPRLSAKTAHLIGAVTRPRPQPIAGTPPPDPNEKCDTKIIQQTCSLFGLDLERPPPVPPSRSYTISGNSKLGYPQSRLMKMNFPEDALALANPAAGGGNNAAATAAVEMQQLKKGETVNVVGASTCRGHLVVEHKGQSYHVPFQYMELLRSTAGSNVTGNGGGSSQNNNNSNNNNSSNNASNNNANTGNSNNNNNNNTSNVSNANNNTAVNANATSAAVNI